MKWVKRIALILVALLVVAQAIRPDMTNPPVDSTKTLLASGQVTPQVEAILDRSCNDCHSNSTVWPWYAKIAPVSWLLADHVKDGRKELNLSLWQTFPDKRKARKLKEMCDQVREGEMPLPMYVPLHPTSKLSDADKQTICGWTASLMARLPAVPQRRGQPAATPAAPPAQQESGASESDRD